MACGGKDKLVIGIPTYGKSYKRCVEGDVKFGDQALCGPIGPIRKSNEWAFFEVCEARKKGRWIRSWQNEHEVPYMYNDNSIITYDSPLSAARKAVFIKYNGYGGAMFWTLDFDDFNGKFCGGLKFPVINAVRQILYM
ncbi:hypothetical protein GJ496_004892 [Pomphorhynchus laevis]|nr:hypothetical protein GJ496_004892 [Pomphorhynchus laevis]